MNRRVRDVVAMGLVAAGFLGLQVLTSGVGSTTDVSVVMPTLPASDDESLLAPTTGPGPAPTASTTPTAPTHTSAGGTTSGTGTGTGSASPATTGPATGRASSNAPPPAGGIVPLIRAGAAIPTIGAGGAPGITASVETELFPGQQGDQADDSAVWRNQAHPERSFVVADNKSESGGGVAVYDLKGRLVNYQGVGKIGNIDLRSGVRVGTRTVTLVGANDRTNSRIRFWSLDPSSGKLTSLDARPLASVAPNYGFCLGRSRDGAHTYAFVSGENSFVFEQYELKLTTGKVDAVKVRTIDVGSLSEACVVDDARGALYLAEEDAAIWRYDLAPATGAKRTAIDTVGGGRLTADIEGLSAARGAGGKGVLVASSQGDSTYSVYDLDGAHAFRGTFAVRDGAAVDGASDTDGLDIGSGSFGPAFPNGLLVVHDAANKASGGGSEAGSNLKFVRFDKVFALTQ